MIRLLIDIEINTGFIADYVEEMVKRSNFTGLPRGFVWSDLPPDEPDPDKRNATMGERERAARDHSETLAWWVGQRDRTYYAVHDWRAGIIAVRKLIPAVAPFVNRPSDPPIDRWTAGLRAELGELGGVINSISVGYLPRLEAATITALRSMAVKIVGRIEALKKIGPEAMSTQSPDSAPADPAIAGAPPTANHPALRLLGALGGLHIVCSNAHHFQELDRRREKARRWRDGVVQAMRASDPEGARRFAQLPDNDEPEHYHESLLDIVSNGITWHSEARAALRDGGGEILNEAFTPGTAAYSVALAEKVDDAMSVFAVLRLAIPHEAAVVREPAEKMLRLAEEFRREQHRLSAVLEQRGLRTKSNEVAAAPANAGTTSGDPAKHGDDFSWVVWFGTTYTFKKGNQAASVRELWKAWEQSGRQDGCGLADTTICEAIGAAEGHFRLKSVFRGHPAMGKMICEIGKGMHALFRVPPAGSASRARRKKPRKRKKN